MGLFRGREGDSRQPDPEMESGSEMLDEKSFGDMLDMLDKIKAAIAEGRLGEVIDLETFGWTSETDNMRELEGYLDDILVTVKDARSMIKDSQSESSADEE